MKMTCPHCAESLDPLALAEHQDVRDFYELLGWFGEENRPVCLAYLRCFRKPGQRAQSISRLLGLLRGPAGIIAAGRFSYKKRNYRGNRQMVLQAMWLTVGRMEGGGLGSANYFKSILADLAGKAEAAEERRTEEARRAGTHRRPGPDAEPSAVGELFNRPPDDDREGSISPETKGQLDRILRRPGQE